MRKNEKTASPHNAKFAESAANSILEELRENPYRRFNIAFALLTIIPVLTFIYFIFTRLSATDIPHAEIAALLVAVVLVTACGALIGYSVIREVLDRILFYAAQAKQSEQRKSAFVAAVSHEFKTPLTILKTNFYNITSGILGHTNPEQNSALKSCDEAINHMDNRINGLLGLYQLESDVWATKRQFCDIGDIASRIIQEFSILLTEKKITLRLERSGDNLLVWADAGNLKSIMNNLLSNAVKYTPEGGEVIFKVLPENHGVRIECLDTGSGIPEDKIGRLFNKFERLDITEEGTGLGLFISKQIVETLKGKIWVENRSEQGARFIVYLPRDSRK